MLKPILNENLHKPTLKQKIHNYQYYLFETVHVKHFYGDFAPLLLLFDLESELDFELDFEPDFGGFSNA